MLQWFLLADPGPLALDPTIAWLRIIIEMGSFALLAFIVIKLAPQLYERAAAERTARDSRFVEALEKVQVKFEERNNLLVKTINEQTRAMSTELERQTERLAAIVEKSLARKESNT